MKNDFIITEILRVVFLDQYEYREKVTAFTNDLACNELVFHLSGRSTLYYNDRTYQLVPDTVRFLPQGPNTRHEVEREEWGDCIFVDFRTDRPVSTEAFTVHDPYTHKLIPLFKKMFSLWVAKDEGYYFQCISMLYRIFAEMQKTNYLPESQFSAIAPAIRYIEEHFLDPDVTARDVVACCEVSYPYIRKLFSKKFGMSPMKYLLQMKINYACDLLQTGLYSVSQIAEICGYRDIYFFSRQFKEYTGLTPTAFTKKYKSSK